MSLPNRQLIREPSLEVTSESFLEAAHDEDEIKDFLDAEDHYGFFCAGVQYQFSQGKREASARCFENEPWDGSGTTHGCRSCCSSSFSLPRCAGR
jgi:hypothetical protein